ncbi:putative Mitochondrial RNA binding protein MRP [Trypanosoma vivax]|uniref:Putative guide RNA binding protein n=1 Tax=Trypanosoma vivax (strain Y486) TaxID=1055687 RepID=G0U8K4_TRYVY|nr:putative guide RNA binding protein [Trypanosoma vivax]KAH8604961.1 putative Mitochondrial RNA binding protein MRP [Trypanosoma vivax]CCC53930.1 putative guide RNA binding protein [Trypanosoma vivax Y486]
MLRRLTGRQTTFVAVPFATGVVMPAFVRFQTSTSVSTGELSSSNASGAEATGASKWRRQTLTQKRARRGQLSPAFDIVHWNDEDISRGHLLRVLHRDSFVVLDYHRQVCRTGEEGNKAERVVSVMLPAVYTARLLAVLEGRMDKVEVHSRYTNATFVPDPSAPYSFSLRCISTKPPQQQQQGAGEETFEWAVNFDAAESLMLQRFLTQALHYNTGFARTTT